MTCRELWSLSRSRLSPAESLVILAFRAAEIRPGAARLVSGGAAIGVAVPWPCARAADLAGPRCSCQSRPQLPRDLAGRRFRSASTRGDTEICAQARKIGAWQGFRAA